MDAPMVAVVTGASSGLGAGLVASFLADGFLVGACARRNPSGTLARAFDIRDATAVEQFCVEVSETLGPIDVWINSAGTEGPIGPLDEIGSTEAADAFAVNIGGALNGTQAYMRHRRPLGGGVLVNITSEAAHRAYEGWGVYCASKAAIEALTAVAAIEGAHFGMKAHAADPGMVDSPMQDRLRSQDRAAFPAVGVFVNAARRGLLASPSDAALAIRRLV